MLLLLPLSVAKSTEILLRLFSQETQNCAMFFRDACPNRELISYFCKWGVTRDSFATGGVFFLLSIGPSEGPL